MQFLYDGIYLSLFQISFSGTPNAEFEFQLRVNGIDSNFHCRRKLGAGGDIGSTSLFVVHAASQDDAGSVWVKSETGGPGAELTMNDSQFCTLGIIS